MDFITGALRSARSFFYSEIMIGSFSGMSYQTKKLSLLRIQIL